LSGITVGHVLLLIMLTCCVHHSQYLVIFRIPGSSKYLAFQYTLLFAFWAYFRFQIFQGWLLLLNQKFIGIMYENLSFHLKKTWCMSSKVTEIYLWRNYLHGHKKAGQRECLGELYPGTYCTIWL